MKPLILLLKLVSVSATFVFEDIKQAVNSNLESVEDFGFGHLPVEPGEAYEDSEEYSGPAESPEESPEGLERWRGQQKIKIKIKQNSSTHFGTKHSQNEHEFGAEQLPKKVESGKKEPSTFSKLINRPTLITSLLDKVLNRTNSRDEVATSFIKLPNSGVCYSWPQGNVQTFDGKVFSYKSGLMHTLVATNSLRISIQFDNSKCRNIPNPQKNCIQTRLLIKLNKKEYVVKQEESDFPEVHVGNIKHFIPCKFDDFEFKKLSANSFSANIASEKISLTGLTSGVIKIFADRSSVDGLCGNFDGNPDNDALDDIGKFIGKWKEPFDGKGFITTADFSTKAVQNQFCQIIKSKEKFSQCRKALRSSAVDRYFEACMGDYLTCPLPNKEDCACNTLEVFVENCGNVNASIKTWREINLCPLDCGRGHVYSKCAAAHQPTCHDALSSPSLNNAMIQDCNEGCICPPKTLLHNGACIKKENCPCLRAGIEYDSGESIQEACNTCVCEAGKWNCTSEVCGAQCSGFGTYHYRTFDKVHMSHNGQCSYTLLKTQNLSILSVCNEQKAHLVSQCPVCSRSILIELPENKIELKSRKVFTVDNILQESLPVNVKNLAYIRTSSSLFVQVRLWNSVEVNWDGHSQFIINVPGKLQGQTQGICGNFNLNQKDDFLTPEHDIESDIGLFFQKWSVSGTCISDRWPGAESQSCVASNARKEMANKICEKIRSSIFSDCHKVVDPVTYYDDCVLETCNCREQNSALCFCPAVAAYAQECANQSISISWRNTVKECGVQCDFGLEYKECGDSCRRTCQDVSAQKRCKSHCIPGCQCPDGKYLDSNQNCVALKQCSCWHQGLQYKAGEMIYKFDEKCVCNNAEWKCNPVEIAGIEGVVNTTLLCDSNLHQEYVHCAPAQPLSCQNMADYSLSVPSVCRNGCICKSGFVLDIISGTCVKPVDCPCHHGGISYEDSAQIKFECNTCTCQKGKWNCTSYDCPGVCSSWGDSHFKTFDSALYDFRGACDYVLAKGYISEVENFLVVNELVPCGSTGVSCSKAVMIMDGLNKDASKIILSKNRPIFDDSNHKKVYLYETELYVFVKLLRLGVTVQWDRGTRISIQVEPKWKGKLQGLCGNFNGDGSDDFQTPSGGLTEISMQIFGNSWKVQSYCSNIEEPVNLKRACSENPNRIAWVTEKCSILKSPKFKACHSEVIVEPYYERCLFDACACDEGGDCECLCTAIAEYVQQCNFHGIHLKWRSQHLCPLQCNEKFSEYDACVPVCPPSTCENLLLKKENNLCSANTCVESCRMKTCSAGEVFMNASNFTCVPVTYCPCAEINGTVYYEGDEVKKDDCHSCFCSRGKVVCNGKPCSDTTVLPSTTSAPSIKPSTDSTIKPCGPNEIFYDCKMKCNQLCGQQLYEAILLGKCKKSNNECISGCWPVNVTNACPPGKFWQGIGICVPADECYCVSQDGTFIKPGGLHVENENTCQCIANKFTCVSPPPTEAVPSTTEKSSLPPGKCNFCPGVKSKSNLCNCGPNEKWNGSECVEEAYCPCNAGLHLYDVGKAFIDDQCRKCLCALGGKIQCSSLPCVCGPNLIASLSPSCDCTCRKCPSGTRLCPTENICIAESNWCDGHVHCSDDEIDCPKPTDQPSDPCPVISCPPGYKPHILFGASRIKRHALIQSEEESHYEESHWTSTETTVEVSLNIWDTAFSKNHEISKYFKPSKNHPKQTYKHKEHNKYGHKHRVCPEFECLPDDEIEPCISPPKCPVEYELEILTQKGAICPIYKCKLKPISDAQCQVADRSIKTFDLLDYKVDICNHMLARDKSTYLWNITMFKTCSILGACTKTLSLMHLGHKIEFYSNMTYSYDDKIYSPHQMGRIGRQKHEFEFSLVGSSAMFISVLRFSIIWDQQNHVQIFVPSTFARHVDGLCGLYNNNPKDDFSMPHGSLAQTTSEFLDSWGNSTSCDTKVCSDSVQKKATKACSFIRTKEFDGCLKSTGAEELIESCVESICACTELDRPYEHCRCAAAENIVSRCGALTNSLQTYNWRGPNNCAAKCEFPEVYHDCFNRICEPSCDNAHDSESCPTLSSFCLPGCYCPEGYVRHNGKCIQPNACRNCICSLHEGTRVITFDKVEYEFESDCTYVLVETSPTLPVNFKIFFSDNKCTSLNDEFCATTFTVISNEQTIVIKRFKTGINKITVSENGQLSDYTWCTVSEEPSQFITVSIPTLNLDLTVFISEFGFKIAFPSQNYFGATSGLCGSCNFNQTDDMSIPGGLITDEVYDFINNWLAGGNFSFEGQINGTVSCGKTNGTTPPTEPPGESCMIPEPNPCDILMDSKIFGSCHSLIDPLIYKQQCEYNFCHQKSICLDIEEYAQDCFAIGVCISWRSEICPYKCPPGLEYRSCTQGIVKTCDNYKTITADTGSIAENLCACPNGLALQNGSCIDEHRCQPCDDKGHYFGDTWSPHSCQTCSCTANGVECLNTLCPKTMEICSIGYKLIIDPETKSECCPRYMCVSDPDSETKCKEPIKPVCGEDQILKQSTGPNNCSEFYCQCKPEEQCPTLVPADSVELLPGMVEIISKNGCCPKSSIVCKPSTCPNIVYPCPEFHERVTIPSPNLCCPTTECRIPNNTCIHEYKWDFNPKGGERERNVKELKSELKSFGDMWYDGPCKMCKCLEGKKLSECTSLKCPEPLENNEFIFTKVPVYSQCCPIYKKTACKMNGKVYSVNETWQSLDENSCRTFACVQDASNGLIISIQETVCQKDCPLGWKYSEPIDSKDCCGSCKPIGCIFENEVHAPNSVWTTDNNCTIYSCSKDFQVVTSLTKCPNIDDCPENQIVDKGCCQECSWKPEDLKNCLPVKVEAAAKSIKVYSPLLGECWNGNSIEEFSHCSGSCDSSTVYNVAKDLHESACQCCKPTEYIPVQIKLTCETGGKLNKTINVPSKCSCKPSECESIGNKVESMRLTRL